MYKTPSDLIKGLQNGEPDAKIVLVERCGNDILLLACQFATEYDCQLLQNYGAEQSFPKTNADRLADGLLAFLVMWFQKPTATQLDIKSWRAFDGTVLLKCNEVLISAVSAANSLVHAPQNNSGETSCGNFKLSWFIQERDPVGGDWGEYEPLEDGSVLIIVCDVTGHGILAYVLACGLPHLWRMCLETSRQLEPGALMGFMDQKLSGILPEGLSIDSTLVRFEDSKLKASYCRGNPPDEINPKAKPYRAIISGGMPLGIGFPPDAFTNTEIAFGKGDELVIASDGLRDQSIGHIMVNPSVSLRHHIQTLNPPVGELHKTIVDQVRNATSTPDSQDDDICIFTAIRVVETDL